MALKPQPTDQRWPHTCRTHCMNNSFLHSYVGGHRPSKIMRFVDKIAKSKYFQKATETEFIKKKMEEVSNTPLLLTVEVQECQGTLAVNIPPPPTDRIWYSAFFILIFFECTIISAMRKTWTKSVIPIHKNGIYCIMWNVTE